MPRKILTGKVFSTKMDKTVVVQVKCPIKHKLYKKVTYKTKKYAAHDPNNIYKGKEGSYIKIIESRPYSKTKTWHIV